MRVVLLVLALVSLWMASCFCERVDWETEDRKCREAAAAASYSRDFDEMNRGMDYFSANCKWTGDVPIAR